MRHPSAIMQKHRTRARTCYRRVRVLPLRPISARFVFVRSSVSGGRRFTSRGTEALRHHIPSVKAAQHRRSSQLIDFDNHFHQPGTLQLMPMIGLSSSRNPCCSVYSVGNISVETECTALCARLICICGNRALMGPSKRCDLHIFDSSTEARPGHGARSLDGNHRI
ncbi:hypothetical protein FA95DRAFT_1419323 [Auriscalpium vulgare]|uniref:Uncharacterized protein n=1 Tax=Auriscalpium vulgare TaxID=40419 RepID=A0ACB8RQF2_9AGAM|nr:hypothetical protein FA95DRAFT_1419323 [Auriscalpium vulgare]